MLQIEKYVEQMTISTDYDWQCVIEKTDPLDRVQKTYLPIIRSTGQEKKLILIEAEPHKVMPLFCKQCRGRRLPIFQSEEKIALWLCEKCENFVDQEDLIIRELKKSERDEMDAKLEDFRKSTESLSGEKRERRKGVN